MAINPTTGMFYISPEEATQFYKPLGTALRKLTGLENEDEYAKRVAADKSLSLQDKRKLLAENLSPEAFDKAEEKLFKSIERQGKANKILGKDKRLSAWENRFKPNFIQSFVSDFFPEMGVIRTETEFKKALTNAVENNQMSTGSRSVHIKDFTKALKDAKTKYDTKYEFRDMDEVLKQLDAGKAELLNSMPALKKPTTYGSAEQIDAKIQENRNKLEQINQLSQSVDAPTIAKASPQLIKVRDDLMKEINKLEEEKDKLSSGQSFESLMKMLNKK